MSPKEKFFHLFHEKSFDKALDVFDTLNAEDRRAILAQLFQASSCRETPSSVSVLFRRLHEGKTFEDFYNAWLPPQENRKPEMVDGYLYQNYFGGPIRIINAINFEDPREVVSIGLHWVTDQELNTALSDPKLLAIEKKRGESISTVANKEKSGIFKVVKDDNGGSKF